MLWGLSQSLSVRDQDVANSRGQIICICHWGGFTPSEASVPAIVKTILQPEPAASTGKECKAFQVVCKGPQWQHVRLFSKLEEQK